MRSDFLRRFVDSIRMYRMREAVSEFTELQNFQNKENSDGE